MARAKSRAAKTVKPATTVKIDLWKEHRDLFRPRAGVPEVVRVPPLKYLMVDGVGSPEASSGFQAAIGALYGMAYTLKFDSKARGLDFRIMPLGARYHAEDPTVFLTGLRAEWRWTLMIMVPTSVTAALLEAARAKLRAKQGPSELLASVRLETLREGTCVQTLHLGPYDAEKPTIESLHRFMEEKGYTFGGSHHEIYLSDPRRSKPEKIKTIIRQPVKRLRTRGAGAVDGSS